MRSAIAPPMMTAGPGPVSAAWTMPASMLGANIKAMPRNDCGYGDQRDDDRGDAGPMVVEREQGRADDEREDAGDKRQRAILKDGRDDQRQIAAARDDDGADNQHDWPDEASADAGGEGLLFCHSASTPDEGSGCRKSFERRRSFVKRIRQSRGFCTWPRGNPLQARARLAQMRAARSSKMASPAEYTIIVLLVVMAVGVWTMFDRLGQLQRDVDALKRKAGIADAPPPPSLTLRAAG